MSFYRCYNISPQGVTLGLQNFQAPNDADAWLIADEIQYERMWYRLELWEGLRRMDRTFDRPGDAA
jgi:hypothetical protein